MGVPSQPSSPSSPPRTCTSVSSPCGRWATSQVSRSQHPQSGTGVPRDGLVPSWLCLQAADAVETPPSLHGGLEPLRPCVGSAGELWLKPSASVCPAGMVSPAGVISGGKTMGCLAGHDGAQIAWEILPAWKS